MLTAVTHHLQVLAAALLAADHCVLHCAGACGLNACSAARTLAPQAVSHAPMTTAAAPL